MTIRQIVTARTQVYDIAKAYSWKSQLSSQPPTIDTFTKGERWLDVRYDKRGRITGATSGTDQFGQLYKANANDGFKLNEVMRLLTTTSLLS